MGVYWYTAKPTPDGVTGQGLAVHAITYVNWDGTWMSKATEDRLFGPTRMAWEGNVGLGPLLLAEADAFGRLQHGGRVFLVAAGAVFDGVLMNPLLGTSKYPPAGTLLLDGAQPEVVSHEQEVAAWVALGAWWRSSVEALEKNHKGYRPSLDCSLSEGLLAARLYDAAAAHRGDQRRAYRYREVAA